MIPQPVVIAGPFSHAAPSGMFVPTVTRMARNAN